jgi:ribonuclease P protein subunit RPR2
MKKSRKIFIKRTVQDAVDILLKEAEVNFNTHPERTKRYLKMVWDLAKKYNLRLRREQKLKFCKKCFMLWVPNETVKISFDRKHTFFEFVCRTCGYKKRFK